MDAEQIISKILGDAQLEADAIKLEADKKNAASEDAMKAELEAFGKESKMLAQQAGEERKSRMLAAARMDIAKEFLAAKRLILDEVFAGVEKDLSNLPDDDYCKMVSRLMKDAVETGDEEVIVDVNEKLIGQELIKNVNRELGPGYKGNLRLSTDKKDIGGGFILKRGKITNNVSFGVLIGQAKDALEIELSQELLGN